MQFCSESTMLTQHFTVFLQELTHMSENEMNFCTCNIANSVVYFNHSQQLTSK